MNPQIIESQRGRRQRRQPVNPPSLCNQSCQATRRVGPRASTREPCTRNCPNTLYNSLFVTDFSQLLLAAAKLHFCWIVVLPTRNHSPGRQLSVFYLVPTNAVPLPRRGGEPFRTRNCVGAQGCVTRAQGRAQSGPKCARRRAKAPKWTPKLLFESPWATLLVQIYEPATLEITLLFYYVFMT